MRAEEIVGRCVDKFSVGIEVVAVKFSFATGLEAQRVRAVKPLHLMN